MSAVFAVATVFGLSATIRSVLRAPCHPLPALSTAIPAVSNIPTLLLPWKCYHTRLVCTDRSTVTTHHESSIARPCCPSIASGCRAATANHRPTPKSSEFAATSDWKKIRTPEGFLKNPGCRLLCQNSFFLLSWRFCSPRVLWPNSFTGGWTKKAGGTTQTSSHPESRRRSSKSVPRLKNQSRNRPSPRPVSKIRQQITRIIPPRLGRMLTHWGQPPDICLYFLRPTQANLSLSGYQLNLSTASKSAKGPEPFYWRPIRGTLE